MRDAILRCFPFLLLSLLVAAQERPGDGADDSCTDIVVGRLASTDGSVINSHTGCCDECRVHVVEGRTFAKGAMADVHYGLQDSRTELRDYGQVIGQIPQVERTYTYFHTGYPQMNEHQLVIAESTLSQRDELKCSFGNCKQIMTIEQAQVFALQRCRTAREALTVITELVDTYGFLPSCGPESEALCISDPNEAWVLEVFAVGPDWDPDSGKAGAIWAAQRVPDDHVCIVPNWSIIKEVDPSKPETWRASKNHRQFAIDRGWWNPRMGPFVWQKVYAPQPREWAVGRLWLFYSTYAPTLRAWPDKRQLASMDSYDAYHQYVEDISIYPFSVAPERKLSVQDVIAFQRSVFDGTIYDMTTDLDWLVPDGEGGMKKSPLTTPFPTRDMRQLLDIVYRRMVSRGGYGMVAQSRSWLPDAIGGVYWLYLDNQYTSTYVPIYAGARRMHPTYQTWNPDRFAETSARWNIDMVDNLLYLKWQEAIEDLRAVRDPLEQSFFAGQARFEKQALKAMQQDPAQAALMLTEYTNACMAKTVQMYRQLRGTLITKYTNNKQGV
ncbi:MAG: dipeptidase [Planctomycetota bacterium]